MDISISLVKRPITYLNRTISEKLEQKINNNFENTKENPRFFETFGKKEKGFEISQEKKPKFAENTEKFSEKNTEKFTEKNHEKKAEKFIEKFIEKNTEKFNEKNTEKILAKGLNLVNPSLKLMTEGNFCPPPMLLIKKAPPSPDFQSQPTQKLPKKPQNPSFVTTFSIFQKTPNPETHPEPFHAKNMEFSPNKNPKKGDLLIDQLIEELLSLRNMKKSPISPNKIPFNRHKSLKSPQKSSIFERVSQKISIKNLEQSPSNPKNSEEYPEDFESASISVSPSHFSKSKHSGSALIPQTKAEHLNRTNEYNEEFDSYNISETVNTMGKVNLGSKSFDESSQSGSQKKIVNCFLCGGKLEASKASEHLKICKSSNMRYSQKKNGFFRVFFNFFMMGFFTVLASNSFKSIEEEEEIAQKDNPVSSKQSLIKGFFPS